MNTTNGKLYLIPTTLGAITDPLMVLPISIKKTIEAIDIFIVENEKTARRFIKQLLPEKKQANLTLYLLNKHTPAEAIPEYLEACLQGYSVGILSEAGCPSVADPGAELIKAAHLKGITVMPLVGPSSILLALMSSGLNGQNFAFNGYLPINTNERKQALKRLERLSQEYNQTQIFMETPYRNTKLLADICSILQPQTLLCIATDLTLPTQFIKTQPVMEWHKNNEDFNKRPSIFLIQKI